ncbi:MAG TPA: DUF2997 domain-containing protein [Bacillales bacterium]|nr:DUF2997 domain-containing protein [Bacillales bacterium]
MNEKKLKIRITEDGEIFAETVGIKGKDCMQYIKLLEELLGAESVDSKYTKEYYETEVQTIRRNNQIIREE